MAADRSMPKTLAGFRVQSELGRGGMGVVYACWDESLQRRVAVKVLAAELAADDDLRSRFLREARAAAALSHPNIATVYAVHAKADEPPAIVMELVEGDDLRRRLREGPLPLAEALAIASGVASAIAKAHSAGIVHRDLKPENILLGEGGLVKLLDFGIAKALDRGPDLGTGAGLTATGQVIGTAGYMAPEQIDGLHIDPRTDVFAFGVIVFEMLTGRVPYDGASAAQRMAAVLRDPPADLMTLAPETPEEIAAWVRSCIEREREKRPNDGAAVASALAAFTGSARVTTQPTGSPPSSEPIPLAGGQTPSPRAVTPARSSPSNLTPAKAATPVPVDFEAKTELSASSDVGARAASDVAAVRAKTATDERAGGSRRGLAIAGIALALAAVVAIVIWPPAVTINVHNGASAQPSVAASTASAIGSPPSAPAGPPLAVPVAPVEDAAALEDQKLEWVIETRKVSSIPTTFPCETLTTAVEGCSEGVVAWCDTNNKQMACCGPGLVPHDADGACGCPPGGSSTARYNTPACPAKQARTGLSGDAVRDTVRARMSDLGKCYEKALAEVPGQSGRVSLSLLIAPNGRTFSAKVKESSLPLPSAQKCMLETLRKLEFPPPRGARGVTVTYPLEFAPD